MNVFLESNYRTILRKVVEKRRAIDAKFNFQAIAAETRIPKSYISKVTTEKAHFSADQLFAVCQCIGLGENEATFVHLLMEYERSVHRDRKAYLNKRIEEMRDRALDTREHLRAQPDSLSEQALGEYYLDPMHQVVHICLSIPRFQTDPQKLSTELGLELGEIREIIGRLERLGVIEQVRGKYRTIIKSIHLPRESISYKPWRNQVKLASLERLGRRARRSDYSFAVTFSATDRVRDAIRGEFLEVLKRAETLVRDADKENTYQLNFDLFGWTGARE